MHTTNQDISGVSLRRYAWVCALGALLTAGAFGQGFPGEQAADNQQPAGEQATGEQPAGAEGEAEEPDTVAVDDYGTVDIHVQDTELAQVLQMLSIQSHKNIITSKSVSATVTATLYNVTFFEALEAILHVNGYGYIEEGNFIYIYTQDELDEMREAMRSRESRIFELEYLAAADAFEFIVPLLSEGGKASFRGDVEPGFEPDLGNGGADGYALNPKLVVNDYPENLDAIAELIYELDVKPQQVLVEATVVQTQLDEANAFGVDFNIIGSLDFTNLTSPLSAVNDLLGGSDLGPDEAATASDGFEPGDNQAQALASTPGNTSGPGTLKVGVISDDVSVFLRVLDQVSDTTVLARPKILALNRQRAQVLVGIKIGYLSTTATETTTTQTVEFLDTGIQLIFRPFISSDGTVRMELAPSVSEASLRTVNDANGLLVTIPDELTNEITTNVRVRDGETLVLGGLFRESTSISRRQVPVLGDVPVLGAAFRGQDDTIDRDEIIFLITPTIMRDEMLAQLGEEALEYTESVRVAARQGLLPFSTDSIASNHNRDAIEAYEAGNLEQALYHVNQSLRIKPNQPSAIQLREDITGAERKTAYERSMMQRVLQTELDRTKSARAEPMTRPDKGYTVPTADPLTEFDNPMADADSTSSDGNMMVEAGKDDFIGGENSSEMTADATEQSMSEPVSEMGSPSAQQEEMPESSHQPAEDSAMASGDSGQANAMPDTTDEAMESEPFDQSSSQSQSSPQEIVSKDDFINSPSQEDGDSSQTAEQSAEQMMPEFNEALGEDAALVYEIFSPWNPWMTEQWWSDEVWFSDEDEAFATVTEPEGN